MVDNKPTTPNANMAVIGALFFMFVILGLPSGLLGVAWPSIRDEFRLTNEAIGAILAMGTLGHIISSFVSGRVVHRWGIYPVLVTGSTLSLVVMGGLALSPTWLLLVLIYGLWGIASGLMDTSANVFVARYYTARVMNWMHASFGLGATLGPFLIGAVIALGFSWRAAYASLALLVLLLLAVFAALRTIWPRRSRTARLDTGATTTSENRGVGLWDTLRIPVIWLSMAIFFFYGGVEITAGQWSFTLFTESRGATAEAAGVWVAAYWAVFTLGRVLAGFIADRLGGWRLLDLSLLTALIGILFYAANVNLPISYLGLVLIGFGIAPIFPTLITLTPRYAGEAHAANAMGFQVGITGVGIAVLPSLAGVLAERVDLEAIGPYLFAQGVVLALLYVWLRARTVRTSP